MLSFKKVKRADDIFPHEKNPTKADKSGQAFVTDKTSGSYRAAIDVHKNN